jgi:hypothetical protein|tara:strand:+ start:499 stop:768 length:270 start_codon:yes stop_codon:yes gene_type:complete
MLTITIGNSDANKKNSIVLFTLKILCKARIYNVKVIIIDIPPAVGIGFKCVLLSFGLSINKECCENFFSKILVKTNEIMIVEKNKINNI